MSHLHDAWVFSLPLVWQEAEGGQCGRGLASIVDGKQAHIRYLEDGLGGRLGGG